MIITYWVITFLVNKREKNRIIHKKNYCVILEATKKVLILMAGPLRGGGGAGPLRIFFFF